MIIACSACFCSRGKRSERDGTQGKEEGCEGEVSGTGQNEARGKHRIQIIHIAK